MNRISNKSAATKDKPKMKKRSNIRATIAINLLSQNQGYESVKKHKIDQSICNKYFQKYLPRNSKY